MRSLSGVFLYDLDDLRSVCEANARQRARQADAAGRIVEEEVQELLAWQRAREVVPRLVEMRRRGDEVRRAELDQVLRRLGPLDVGKTAALEAATSAIVNKLLHAPTVRIKELAREGRTRDLGLLRRVMGLADVECGEGRP